MTPEQTAEMLSLQAQLAYSAARSDIECYCLAVFEGTDRWRDPVDVDKIDREDVDTALRYLELRGLIERHPTQPWVRVREEA